MVCLAVAAGAGLWTPPGSVLRDKRPFFVIAGLSWLVLAHLLHRKAVKEQAACARGYWKTVAFVLVALSLAAGFLEATVRLGLWIAGASPGELSEFNRKWHWAVSQGYYRSYEGDYPYLPYRVRPNEAGSSYSNPKGYRGKDFSWQKPPGTIRVACLGGSTTWEGTYPAALERALNARSAGGSPGVRYEVLNFGAEAWSSAEILVNYAVRGCHADPDVVVSYEAVNDVVAASHPADVQPEPDYSHWRRRLKPPAHAPWMTEVPLTLDRLALVCVIRNLSYRRHAVDTWLTAMQNYPFDGNQQFQGTETFRSNVEGLVAIALSRASSVFLVTQVHSPDWSRKASGNDQGIQRTAAMHDVLRELARKYRATGKVFLIDAANEAESLGLYAEMHDWCHFSEAGYTKLGERIAEEILRQAPAPADQQPK